MEKARAHVVYSGRVQGVGFRYTARSIASGYDVTGWVKNLPDGRVELVAEGDKNELEAFCQAVRTCPLGSLIQDEDLAWETAEGDLHGFRIAG